MKLWAIQLFCLSIILLLTACDQPQFKTASSLPESNPPQERNEIPLPPERGTPTPTPIINNVKVTLNTQGASTCSDVNAKIEITVVGAGNQMRRCLSYVYRTEDSRDGESFNCDSDYKFQDPLHLGWSYDTSTDTWSYLRNLRDFSIPGDYVLHIRSSDALQTKSVSYQLRNIYGDPNLCLPKENVTPTPTPISTCSGSAPPSEIQTTACINGQLGSQTQTRSYSCVGTTWTAGAWVTTSDTCHYPPPPPPGSCPAAPAGMLTATLPGSGNPIKHAQASGQVTSIPVPFTSSNQIRIIVSETPSVGSPQPVTIQASVSKCAGHVYIDPTDFCTLNSTNGNYNAITMVTKPHSWMTDREIANKYGYCWAPESEGQWYFNVRWYYELCGFGLATCGFAIQYNLN